MNYWKEFEWDRFLGDVFSTIAILAIAIVVWMVIASSLRLLEKRSNVPKTLLLPLRLVLRYGFIIVTFLLILSTYGIAIGNFWTFVSTIVGLVAIGFVAVWSVLSNISSTFLIMLIQPFKVGEYVKIVGDDVMGRVIDINFMFTTIRKGSGDIFKVPNNQFFQKSLLKPADPSKLEDEDSGDEAEESPHKDQNLEGIRMPSPAPAKGPR